MTKICMTGRRRKAAFEIFRKGTVVCKGTVVLKLPTSKDQMVLVRRVTLHQPAENKLGQAACAECEGVGRDAFGLHDLHQM